MYQISFVISFFFFYCLNNENSGNSENFNELPEVQGQRLAGVQNQRAVFLSAAQSHRLEEFGQLGFNRVATWRLWSGDGKY